MAVSQLGRIAEGVGWHSVHALVIHVGGGLTGQHHLIAQPGQKGEPEWIILVHVKHPGNTDFAPWRSLQRLIIVKQPVIFEAVDILHLCRLLFLACTPLAAVAGKIASPVREILYRYQAGIAAAMAAEGFCLDGKAFQLLRR